MAARIAWLLNLDADLELRDPVGYRAARLEPARRAELLARIADLIAPEDLVLDQDAGSRARPPNAPTLAADCAVLAFCPTPSALARLAMLGLPVPPAPAFSVLREVNGRAFCAALGHGLAGAAFVRDMAALEEHLTHPSPTATQVIKREFSFAGREQRRVHEGRLDASSRGFCERSFAHGEGLQVEPWVERLADFGMHGYLTRDRALLMGTAREQHCDAMGRFVGMSTERAQLSQVEEASFASELERTSAALSAAGYFGPFGIDGFRYRLAGGEVALRCRCEINARFSMGYPRALLLAGLAADARIAAMAIF